MPVPSLGTLELLVVSLRLYDHTHVWVCTERTLEHLKSANPVVFREEPQGSALVMIFPYSV